MYSSTHSVSGQASVFPLGSLRFESVNTTQSCYLPSPPIYITTIMYKQTLYLTAQRFSRKLVWAHQPSRNALFVVDTTTTTDAKVVVRSQRWLNYTVDETSWDCLCFPPKHDMDSFRLTRNPTAGLSRQLFDHSPSTISSSSTPIILKSQPNNRHDRYILRSRALSSSNSR